jgi:hypothetical protein
MKRGIKKILNTKADPPSSLGENISCDKRFDLLVKHLLTLSRSSSLASKREERFSLDSAIFKASSNAYSLAADLALHYKTHSTF